MSRAYVTTSTYSWTLVGSQWSCILCQCCQDPEGFCWATTYTKLWALAFSLDPSVRQARTLMGGCCYTTLKKLIKWSQLSRSPRVGQSTRSRSRLRRGASLRTQLQTNPAQCP